MSTEPNFVHYLPHLIASGESGLAILIEHNAERLPVKSARLEQDEKGVRLTWVSAGELGVVEIVDLSESAHLDAIVAGWAHEDGLMVVPVKSLVSGDYAVMGDPIVVSAFDDLEGCADLERDSSRQAGA